MLLELGQAPAKALEHAQRVSEVAHFVGKFSCVERYILGLPSLFFTTHRCSADEWVEGSDPCRVAPFPAAGLW